MIKKIFTLSCTLSLSLTAFAQVTPQNALTRLLEGNERYTTDKLQHPNRGKEARDAVVAGQTPFATILSCSDSRVSPEIVFDQGIGDLFIVRVAGNVIGPIEQESIDYASIYLGSSLILVLGHEKCGAVQAVLNGTTKDIETVAALITPAVKEAKEGQEPIWENAIKDNVLNMVRQLKANTVIAELMKNNKLDVVGGYYSLSSGKIQLLTSQAGVS